MDSQTELFRYLNQQEHSSTLSSSVSPLVDGAKKSKASLRMTFLNKTNNPAKNSKIKEKIRKKLIDKQLEKYKNILITKEAEQVLLGSLLGDGNLRKHKHSPSFSERHCMKQQRYLEWKSQILNLPSKSGIVYLKKNGKQINYPMPYYVTKSIPQLIPYHNLFYPNGKKIVTQEILDKIEPLGIAVWYMDDGYFDLEVSLATHGFTHQENILIQNWFKEKWGIHTRVAQTKNKKGVIQYYLRIKRKESLKFIELIKSNIHPVMQYKTNYDINKFRERDRKRNKTEKRKLSWIKKYYKNKAKILCPLCSKNCIGRTCRSCYYATKRQNSKKLIGNKCLDCGNKCCHVSIRCRTCNNKLQIRRFGRQYGKI